MKFFVIIGKENLFVFEKNGNQYIKQFIEGSPFYPYDVNSVDENINAFLDDLANEKNLGTKAKLEFDVLENEDMIRTNSVMRVMGEYVTERFSIPDTIRKVIKKLSKDKKLLIDQYGINYDSVCYKIDKENLLISPFDLLAYTVHEEDIIELI